MKLAFGLFVSFAMFVAAPLLPKYFAASWGPAWAYADAYALSVIAILVALALVGQHVMGRVWGMLINERNVMSLTRFQTVLWTVLVTAAFSTLLLSAIYSGHDATKVATDGLRPDLLALMGISYASAVASGMVQSNKATKTADKAEVQKAAINNQVDKLDPQGVLFRNASAKDAAFTDMFEGDEVADAHLIDMAKMQMFFFTLVSGVYFVSQVFGQAAQIGLDYAALTIPALPQSLIALMGISHAGYLGAKTTTKTKEASDEQEEEAPAPQPAADKAFVTSDDVSYAAMKQFMTDGTGAAGEQIKTIVASAIENAKKSQPARNAAVASTGSSEVSTGS